MKIKTIKSTLPIFIALTVGACGSLGGKKLEDQQRQKINKVAILSFSLSQQQPADNLGIGAFTKSASGQTVDAESSELKELTKTVYDQLENGLEKALGKDVVDRESVVSNTAYKNMFKDKMTGIRASAMPIKGTEFLYVDGIIDQANFQGLPFAEKVKLAKSVGADAFVEFNGYQSISQGWGLANAFGGGDFQLTTRSNITMYSIHSDEPIWRSQNIDGEKSKNSSEIKEGSQLKKLKLIGVESAQSSINVMLSEISK